MDAFRDTVIDDIYQAALDGAALPRMFAGIGRLVGSEQGVLLSLGEQNSGIFTVNISPETIQAYSTIYAGQDKWHHAARAQGRLNDIATGQELLPTREFERSEYFDTLLRPSGIYDGLSMTLDPEHVTCISFYRPRSVPFFSDRDKNVLTGLRPHLHRMVRLRRRFERHLIDNTLPIATLDVLTFGVVLVRGDGSLLFVNRAARRMFARRNGLSVRGNRLVSLDHASQDQLTSCLKRALGAPGQPVCGSDLAIRRRDTALPYLLQFLPLALGGDETLFVSREADRRAALVVITDPTAQPRPPLALLRSLFGLTETEAEIAIDAGFGQSLAETAEARHITEGTARWHLKNVERKTGVRRLTQLATLLAQLARRVDGGQD